MISKALDSNNDIFIEGGSFNTVTDAAETIQAVRCRLLFYKEEWFLDLLAGTAWFQEVFVKPVNLANVESILKRRILQTDGVDRLIEFAVDFDSTSRKLTVSFSAETIYGIINISEVSINV